MNAGPRLLLLAEGSTGASLQSALAERLPDAEADVTSSAADARSRLVDGGVDCLVVVLGDAADDAFALVDDARHRAPPVPVVAVGGPDATERTAVRAFRADVTDYVPSDASATAAADLIAGTVRDEHAEPKPMAHDTNAEAGAESVTAELGRGSESVGTELDTDSESAAIATGEAIPDPFLAVSTTGDLIEWNAAVEQFAAEPDRLDTDGLDAVLDTPEGDRLRRTVEGVAPGETVVVVVEFDDPVDGAVPHEFIGVGVERPEGGAAACGVARDVSVRRRRERVLHGLQHASRDLMAAETVAEAAERTVAAAVEVLDQPQSGVHLLDESTGTLQPVAISEAGRTALEEEVPELGPGTLAWQAFEADEVRRFHDVRAAEQLRNPETDIRSELIVPLGDHGVFIVSSCETDKFTAFDETFARILSATAAAAIDRSDRTELLRRRERALTERNETLDRFVSTVSHDLRSPLTVASGRVDLAVETTDLTHLEPAADALDRAEEIVEDLLTLVKQGESIGDLERVDVATVAKRAWTGVDTGDATLGVAEDVGTVRADPGRLRQLLENLYGNAVEHNDDLSRVWVRREGDALVVADDGAGFDDTAAGRLFEAGFTTDDDGTGYGLSIVQEVANAHGWSVSAGESEAGGARFVLDIDPDSEAADPVESGVTRGSGFDGPSRDDAAESGTPNEARTEAGEARTEAGEAKRNAGGAGTDGRPVDDRDDAGP